MKNSVLVLGGYGNFGKRISRALARKGVPVVIAGRDAAKAQTLAQDIGTSARGIGADIPRDLASLIADYRPAVIVNTIGPFQGRGYEVAQLAINAGVHYLDLADGREFVCGISALDEAAKAAGVAVISGASTVPALSDAVCAEYSREFARIERMRYGISPGQGTERGLATTQGIMGYVGRRLAPFNGIRKDVYGWQDLYRQAYPSLGKRWMANCDIPDLDLLPERYDIKTIQFSAGLELSLLHLGLWGASWIVRSGLPLPLERRSAQLLSISNCFNRFGTSDGGMHVILTGHASEDPDTTRERRWFILARGGDGPNIPTIPAILIAHRIASGQDIAAGARPCLGLISLQEYLAELSAYDIEVFTECRSTGP